MPKLVSRLYVGIKYGKDGTNVALSVAARTAGDKIFVETIDCRSLRSGNAWIIKFLKSADIAKIVIDGASGQQILKKDMHTEKVRPIPTLPTVAEVIEANATFLQGVEARNIRHMNQRSLAGVVTNSKKRAIGSRGGFGFETFIEGADISLMDSAILAYWACSTSKKRKKTQRAYY